MKLLLENWREYVNEMGQTTDTLKERQSIPLSPSTREWVKNSWKAYRSAQKEGSLKPDQTIFSDHIEGYNGKKVLVSLVTKDWEADGQKDRTMASVPRDTNLEESSQIVLRLSRRRDYGYEGTWSSTNDWKIWSALMMHELTHVVDPKAKLDPNIHPAGRSYAFGTEEYYTSDIEVDGYIRTAIEDLNQWGPDGFGGPWTKEDVRNYKPRGTEQKIWYEKYPKIWRKLINALYAEVEGS